MPGAGVLCNCSSLKRATAHLKRRRHSRLSCFLGVIDPPASALPESSWTSARLAFARLPCGFTQSRHGRPAPQGGRAASSGEARQVEAVLAGAVDRDLVAGIGVAHDAGGGIVPQHALDAGAPPPACRRRRSPCRHAARSPCRRRRRGAATPRSRREAQLSSAFSSGQSETASEPSRIASVSRFGRGDRAGVEVVAADDDRRLQLAAWRPSR